MFTRSASFYELLDVEPSANRQQVLSAWMDKRRAALSMTAVLGKDQVGAICAQLDEAFRTLTHPLRGRTYARYQEALPETSPRALTLKPSSVVSAAPQTRSVETPSNADSPQELPSITTIARLMDRAQKGTDRATQEDWIQLSLPLTQPDNGGLGADRQVAEVTASHRLQGRPEPAAALQHSSSLFTVELLDSLELLEQVLSPAEHQAARIQIL